MLLEQVVHEAEQHQERLRGDRSCERARRHIVAVVIWLLTRSPVLSEAYLLSSGSRAFGSLRDHSDDVFVSCVLYSWLQRHFDAVARALTDFEDSYRAEADGFLVRSLVAQSVSFHNAKGISVPTSHAIDLYLRLWSMRPCPVAVQRVLLRLVHHRNTRRKFGQQLRREWMLEIGAHCVARDLTQEEIQSRALS